MRQRSKRSKSVIKIEEPIPMCKLENFQDSKNEDLSGISMLSTDNVEISDSENFNGQLSAAYDYDVSPSLPTLKYGKLVILDEIVLLEKLELEIGESEMADKPKLIDYRIKVLRIIGII